MFKQSGTNNCGCWPYRRQRWHQHQLYFFLSRSLSPSEIVAIPVDLAPPLHPLPGHLAVPPPLLPPLPLSRCCVPAPNTLSPSGRCRSPQQSNNTNTTSTNNITLLVGPTVVETDDS
eukprot:GHVS01059792.1.p1 GENE.GHVS01059792.1~~GHVS01059792.1.p1  ORF type:complete len:117 (+),score=22.57 GHVS01059792.1:497-847(+)